MTQHVATATPADLKAEARKVMAQHAATPRRGWDSQRARADLHELWDVMYEAWLDAAGASRYDEVGL